MRIMRKIFALAIIFLSTLLFNSTNAQILNWYQTNGPQGIEKTRGFAGDSAGNIYLLTDRILYKSSDSAKSWQQLKIFDRTLSSITIDKNNGIVLNTNSGTAYISSDEGVTWDIDTQYEDIKRDSGNGLYKVQNSRILRSSDSGVSWTDITPSVSAIATVNSLNIYNDDFILCSASYDDPWGSTAGGIYLSKDYGKTWEKFYEGSSCEILNISSTNQIYTRINRSVYSAGDLSGSWKKLFDFLYYAEVMTNDRGVYIFLADTNSRLLHSSDNITWNTIIQFNSVVELKFFVSGENIIIGYYDRNGIYKSADSGTTWTVNKDDFFSLTANSLIRKDDKIYCATSYGMYETEDFGNNWKLSGLENVELHYSSISSEGELYVGAWNVAGGIYKLSGENTFLKMSNGLPADWRDNILAIKAVGPSNVIASGWWNTENNFYLSTDKGNSWTTLSNSGGFNQIIVDSHGRIYCPNREYIIYSDDQGVTWDKTSFNVWRATSMAINSKDEIFAGTFVGIYKSTDRGSTWNQVYTPQGISLIDYMFIDSKDNIYFIEDNRGRGQLYHYVYDNGPSWKKLNSQFYNLGVSSIEEDSQGHLLIGTINGGVFRSLEQIATPVIEKEEIPAAFKLYQNYPNPFNPSTVITYQLSLPGRVSLKVYDLLGREEAVLVNEFQQPGTYRYQFQPGRPDSKLSSGVYFYRIETGNFAETKKLILLK